MVPKYILPYKRNYFIEHYKIKLVETVKLIMNNKLIMFKHSKLIQFRHLIQKMLGKMQSKLKILIDYFVECGKSEKKII